MTSTIALMHIIPVEANGSVEKAWFITDLTGHKRPDNDIIKCYGNKYVSYSPL